MTIKEKLIKLVISNDFITRPRLKSRYLNLIDELQDNVPEDVIKKIESNLEKAFNDGAKAERERFGEFNIDNYK